MKATIFSYLRTTGRVIVLSSVSPDSVGVYCLDISRNLLCSGKGSHPAGCDQNRVPTQMVSALVRLRSGLPRQLPPHSERAGRNRPCSRVCAYDTDIIHEVYSVLRVRKDKNYESLAWSEPVPLNGIHYPRTGVGYISPLAIRIFEPAELYFRAIHLTLGR
jgi:hypothetical protein